MNEEIYIRILTCKTAEIDQKWNFPDMLCTYWRFYINNRSGASLTAGGKTYPLIKNKMYIIPAWQRVSLHNDTSIKNFYVHFDLIGLTGFLCHQIFPPLMEFESSDYTEFEDILKDEYENSFNRLIINSRLKSIIHELLFKYMKNIPEKKRAIFEKLMPATGKYSKLFEYIDNNLSTNIDNVILASQCNKSQSHFIRDFSEATGITPAKFVTQRRIAKAIEMLVFTNDTIEEIAYETGFTDRFHFSKIFKKITGTPPATYRKHIDSVF